MANNNKPITFKSKAALEAYINKRMQTLSDEEEEVVETKTDKRAKQNAKSRIARTFTLRSAEFDGLTKQGNPQFVEARFLGSDGNYYKATRFFNNLDDATK
jgi:hypothetical protein